MLGTDRCSLSVASALLSVTLLVLISLAVWGCSSSSVTDQGIKTYGNLALSIVGLLIHICLHFEFAEYRKELAFH